MDITKSLIDSSNYLSWKIEAHRYLEAVEERVQAILQYFDENNLPRTDPSASIHPSAIIGENVIISKNVHVGPFCYIRDYTILGEDAFLGYGVEVSNSLILRRTQIHHTAFVGNSVIGEECNLGAWFVSTTRRIGNKNVGRIPLGDFKFWSDRRHHGVVIGDHVEVGVNVSTMPGATIGYSSIIFPSSIIWGEIPPNSHGFFRPYWTKTS